LGDQQFRQEGKRPDKLFGPGPLAQVSPKEELLENDIQGGIGIITQSRESLEILLSARALAPASAETLLIKDGFEER